MVATTRTPSSISDAIVLRMRPAIDLSEDEFFAFCQLNSEWRIERTAVGALEIMAPTGGYTSGRNFLISGQLAVWALRDGSGVGYDSSGGFVLPNGAVRSPDTSWVRQERLEALSEQDKERFLPLCPDFVIELRSPSDSVPVLQAKLAEYQANGAELGWLIDPVGRHIHIYRLGQQPEVLESPDRVGGEQVLPGFVLDLRPIWAR